MFHALPDAEPPAVKRDVSQETNKVQTGQSKAVSSHKALFYNLISPFVLRRLAKRLTVGGEKYGLVQWRMGINDREYVADRFNHTVEHLLKFMEGDTTDDNLAAVLWGVHCLMEVERLSPKSLKNIVGICNMHGEWAEQFTEEEKQNKS